MARQCIFCGSTSDLTREHVLPDWLTEIGLDTEPSIHHAGPLNRLPRQWSAKPFRTTVKMVCATCKTTLVSLLVSSDEARMSGYGVPPGEYAALYAQRDPMEPLPFSQDWIGSYKAAAARRRSGSPRLPPDLDAAAEQTKFWESSRE